MVAQEFAMKSLIALLVFTCMATAQPQAAPDAPSTDQQVLELFQLMHIREQTLAVLQSSKEQIKATNRNMLESRLPNIKPAQLAELDAIVDETSQQIRHRGSHSFLFFTCRPETSA
jgi:hypothetical protein